MTVPTDSDTISAGNGAMLPEVNGCPHRPRYAPSPGWLGFRRRSGGRSPAKCSSATENAAHRVRASRLTSTMEQRTQRLRRTRGRRRHDPPAGAETNDDFGERVIHTITGLGTDEILPAATGSTSIGRWRNDQTRLHPNTDTYVLAVETPISPWTPPPNVRLASSILRGSPGRP